MTQRHRIFLATAVLAFGYACALVVNQAPMATANWVTPAPTTTVPPTPSTLPSTTTTVQPYDVQPLPSIVRATTTTTRPEPLPVVMSESAVAEVVQSLPRFAG